MDETSSLRDETTSLRDETSSLKDETSSLRDETSSLTDETSSLTDETSSLTDEDIATPDALTGLWRRFLSAAACGWKKFLSAWNSNPWQMRLVLISLLVYMADVITDIMLAKQYYSNGDYYWLGCTLGQNKKTTEIIPTSVY
ncbi:hypothetical protein Bbelb_098070 [Branchiostoma belcheri]|nr:hypothetical protein Bbelb_098070 [Branchiostoma belcheri]